MDNNYINSKHKLIFYSLKSWSISYTMSVPVSKKFEQKYTQFAKSGGVLAIEFDDFTLALYETKIDDALYEIRGSDEDGNIYKSLIYVKDFEGQDCQEYIEHNPDILEKMFEFGKAEISIKDSSMICNFTTDIMSAKITLPKFSETQTEKKEKTIEQQEKKITEMEAEIKNLTKTVAQFECEMDKIKSVLNTTTEQTNRLAEISADDKYVSGNDKSYPRGILGTWISGLRGGRSRLMLNVNESGNLFTTSGELSTKAQWKNGIFYWAGVTEWNKFETEFRFDPKTPDIIFADNQKLYRSVNIN
jgi:hypothetical protein